MDTKKETYGTVDYDGTELTIVQSPYADGNGNQIWWSALAVKTSDLCVEAAVEYKITWDQTESYTFSEEHYKLSLEVDAHPNDDYMQPERDRLAELEALGYPTVDVEDSEYCCDWDSPSDICEI